MERVEVMTDLLDEYLPQEGAGREEFRLLYSWTFEDAWSAQEEFLEKSPKAVRGPFPRWVAARDLIQLAEQFKETGDNRIILEAISICAVNGFSIPRWCSAKYLEAFRDVWHHRVKSWDDSFGAPHPKGAQVDAMRRRRENAATVYKRVQEIKREEPETGDVPISLT